MLYYKSGMIRTKIISYLSWGVLLLSLYTVYDDLFLPRQDILGLQHFGSLASEFLLGGLACTLFLAAQKLGRTRANTVGVWISAFMIIFPWIELFLPILPRYH